MPSSMVSKYLCDGARRHDTRIHGLELQESVSPTIALAFGTMPRDVRGWATGSEM